MTTLEVLPAAIHAARHAAGGADPVTPAAIGADVAGTAATAIAALNLGTASTHPATDFATPSDVATAQSGAVASAATDASTKVAAEATARSAGDALAVKVATDIGGTAASPQVIATHLAAPLPLAQGGTGSGLQNFLDLTTAQAVAGVKTFASLQVTGTPVTSTDVPNKAYTDAAVQGLINKGASRLATAAALPANTYSGGVLTAAGNGALSVDGVAVAASDQVIVKNEAAQANNGLYVVTATGSGGAPYVLTRASSMNSSGTISNAYSFVSGGGSTNLGTGWNVAGGAYTLGTTAIVWAQFSGATTYTGGSGISVTGTVIAVNGTVATAASVTAEAATARAAEAANAAAVTTEASTRASADALLAPLASPAFTGPATVDGSQIATQALLPAFTGVYAVQLFGAVGDGVTDDTVAIQATINACPPGGTVAILSTGAKYLISATLIVPSTITIEGNHNIAGTGSGIKAAAGSNLDAMIASSAWFNNSTTSNSGITIKGVALFPNTANQTGGLGHGIVIGGWRCVVTGCLVGGQSDKFTGQGVTFTLTGRNGTTAISGTAPENRCTGNIVNGGTHCVRISGSAVTDAFIEDNILIGDGATTIGVALNNGSGSIVSGNHFYSVARDIATSNISVIRIVDNYFEVPSAPASSGAVHMIHLNVIGGGVVIANNHFRMPTGLVAGNTYVGIYAQFVATGGEMSVTGNTIDGGTQSTDTLMQFTVSGGGTGVVSLAGNALQPANAAQKYLNSAPASVVAEFPDPVGTKLLVWAYAQSFQLVSATRDVNEAITTASITWPDGSTGTFTTDTASTAFPGAIDAYHVTYVNAASGTKTITQTAVTRDSGGAVTAQPALSVA